MKLPAILHPASPLYIGRFAHRPFLSTIPTTGDLAADIIAAGPHRHHLSPRPPLLLFFLPTPVHHHSSLFCGVPLASPSPVAPHHRSLVVASFSSSSNPVWPKVLFKNQKAAALFGGTERECTARRSATAAEDRHRHQPGVARPRLSPPSSVFPTCESSQAPLGVLLFLIEPPPSLPFSVSGRTPEHTPLPSLARLLWHTLTSSPLRVHRTLPPPMLFGRRQQ